MFDSYLNESILKRANKAGKIAFKFYNPREFSPVSQKEGRRQVDDKPYGGGPGMVMQAEPVLRAAERARRKCKTKSAKCKTILLSPGGKQLTNAYADNLRKNNTDIIIIAGRYEGIDARVKRALKNESRSTKSETVEEISIGPYTLTGGELPAMVVIDSVTRRIPGVLGKDESVEERRVSSREVYTRPETIKYKGKSYRVPKILLSGHHKEIDGWRAKLSSRKRK